MCGIQGNDRKEREKSHKKIPVAEAVGLKLAHDITEIRPDEIKCRAYKRGYVVRQDDIEHFLRLGKEHVFVLNIEKDEMHENEAAYCLATALMGNGVKMEGEPKEGKGLMKKLENFIVVLSITFSLIGSCSFEPGINKSKFAKLNATANAVKTSIAKGESYQQVSDKVQQLSIEITALKDRVTTKEEKELLEAYSDLLTMYRDGLLLWKSKLDFASFESMLKGRIYVGQDIEPIVLKYRFSMESHLYKPTGQYWKSIPGDSIQIIWSNADSQLKIIENMPNY